MAKYEKDQPNRLIVSMNVIYLEEGEPFVPINDHFKALVVD